MSSLLLLALPLPLVALLLLASQGARLPSLPPLSRTTQQLQRLAHGLALLAGAHVLLLLHLYRGASAAAQRTPYSGRHTDAAGKMHPPPPRRLRDSAQRWLATHTPEPLKAVLLAAARRAVPPQAPPPPLSGCFRALPPELSMLILRLGLRSGALRAADVACLSRAHAASVRRLLLAHMALRSPSAMHGARVALLAAPPAARELPRALFLGAMHAGAAEQLLLLLPALPTLALSARAQRSLLASPCARMRSGARPAHLLLDAVPSGALPLYAHVERLTLFVPALPPVHALALLAFLPKLARLELRLEPVAAAAAAPQQEQEQPFRTQVAHLASALRTLRAKRPALTLDVAAPPRIAAALRRRLGIAHRPALLCDEEEAKMMVRSLTQEDLGGLEAWSEREMQRIWVC